MKRLELGRHLQKHGCELLREGGKHTVFVNRAACKATKVHDIAKSTNFSHDLEVLNAAAQLVIRADA